MAGGEPVSGEPQVTEADRAKAAELLRGNYRQEAIAGALAAEREKARAPFLALAGDWERQAGLVANHNDLVVSIAASTLSNVVRGIRQVAEEREHVHRWAEITLLGDTEIHLLCTLPECGARRTEPRT